MRALRWAAVALAASWTIPATAAGDPEAGRVAGNTCLGCHGIPGYYNAYPTYRVPKLGGQTAEYLELALKAYRAGNRPHPTMHAQAAEMSDQDISNIAAYLSQAPAGRQR
jgi:cytochrome c553